ncbi:MAG: hypothetical protein DRO18_04260, partial [Thermoprotei archaeon]
MRLRFLGTKAYTEKRSRRHSKDSAVLFEDKGVRLLLDCGEDHADAPSRLKPDAILITHGHPDHVGGLKDYDGSIPVYLSDETDEITKDWPFEKRFRFRRGASFQIGHLTIETVPVVHSTRAPAVGFIIDGGRFRIGYFPDWLDFERESDRNKLKNLDLLISDGSAVSRSIVRRVDSERVGHISMKKALRLAKELGIRRVIFTHFGDEVLTRGDEAVIEELKEEGAPFSFAKDGFEFELERFEEFHKEGYDPSKLDDRVLADDFRLLAAKYS